MLKISRESEINLVNVLIDNDIISGKDLINIKKVSTENNKSQIENSKHALVTVLSIEAWCLDFVCFLALKLLTLNIINVQFE